MGNDGRLAWPDVHLGGILGALSRERQWRHVRSLVLGWCWRFRGASRCLLRGWCWGRWGRIELEQAQAAPTCTDTWTNSAGGDWGTTGNWSTGVVPGSGDVRVYHHAPGTYAVEITEADGSEQTVGLVLGAGTTTGVRNPSRSTRSASLTAGTTANNTGGALAELGHVHLSRRPGPRHDFG